MPLSILVFLYATQVFYEKNPGDRYCTVYAEPKVRKVREQFAERATADR